MPARRETARYMVALALVLGFAPSLIRPNAREQLAISLGQRRGRRVAACANRAVH